MKNWPWRWRLAVGFIFLGLAVLPLLISDIPMPDVIKYIIAGPILLAFEILDYNMKRTMRGEIPLLPHVLATLSWMIPGYCLGGIIDLWAARRK